MTEITENLADLPEAQAVYIGLLLQNNQRMLFRTNLFGFSYVWMQDKTTKTVYLERLPEND